MLRIILFFISIMIALDAKPFHTHYIPIQLVKLDSQNLNHSERQFLKEELNHQLKIHGLKLSPQSQYHLKVTIKGFKPYNATSSDFIEKKSTARYKGKVKLKVKFYEFLNTVYHDGDISAYYDVEKIGWSKHDAVLKTRRYVLKDLAKHIAKEVTSHTALLKKHYIPEHKTVVEKNNQLLKSGEGFDFDSGKVNFGYMSDDIRWKKAFAKDDMHILEVKNFARCAIFKDLSYKDVDLDFIKSAKLSSFDITVFDHDSLFEKGDILLCKTSENNYVKLQLLDVIPQNGSKKDILYFKWKLYK